MVTLVGGYFLGAQGHPHLWSFLSVLIGMCLVIACGCVFNNCIDQDIDSLMERTKNRVLVQGLMSKPLAILYGIFLGILGFLSLYLGTNLLTMAIAFVGLFSYVVLYSLASKRRSSYGTPIGGLAGAVPPVAGYCAVTNQFDGGALALFLILFFWQLPHFYAISIYRLQDFAAAQIPVLPLTKTLRYTKISMLIYIVLFTVAAILPTLLGYAGWVYFAIALVLGLVWLGFGLLGFSSLADRHWARRMFLFSVIAITLLCIAMIVF